MASEDTLQSVRRLLAFACLLLSLLVLGISQIIPGGIDQMIDDLLLFAGIASTAVSALWFFGTLVTMGLSGSRGDDHRTDDHRTDDHRTDDEPSGGGSSPGSQSN